MKKIKNRETIRRLFLAFEDEFYKSLDDSVDYNEISNRLNLKEELFKNCVNEDIYDLYNEVSEIQSELNAFYIEEAFIIGFKTAYDLYRDSI